MPEWRELAQGVLVRRYRELDLTIGVVLGEHHALVIDTRGDSAQGAELARAVRQVTDLPWHVAITHGHFDHCFGTVSFRPAAIWAQRRCAAFLLDTIEQQRAEWIEHYRASGDPDTAAALAATEVPLPTHAVRETVDLDLGGRVARMKHPGAGHTDHDLVVHLPDVSIVFAGDLVEHGAPPDFEHSNPGLWPSTLDKVLRLDPETIVPGHGDSVGRDFVRDQRAEIATVAELRAAVRDRSLTEERALGLSPYPPDTTRAALRARS